MNPKRWLAVAALALFVPASYGRVTTLDAQQLPLRVLAKKVLGEVGLLMIGVQRPSWGSKPLGPYPPHLAWPPPRIPPLDQLRFFGRAEVTGSQFGMCGSDWVTVDFKDSGEVESIRAQRHYGVAGPIYRAPGTWTYAEAEKICDSVKSTRHYFPAPDPGSALTIATYVDAIHGIGPFARQRFSYSCSGCTKTSSRQWVLQWLTLRRIRRVRKIDCGDIHLKLPSCFRLVLDNSDGLLNGIYRIYGSDYMNHIVVTSVVVRFERVVI